MTTVRDFNFPLNVYGALLEWSLGRLDYLHYGLFDSVDEPVAQAQERASDRLWAQMPPPCRVLEVGIGVGTTLNRLRERGYSALGITPEPAQAAYARRRHGDALAVETTRLEDLGPGHGPYDLMLLQESAQYIEPLALFEAADRLLASDKATLLVMDEFALRRDSDAHAGLHLLPHFLALAQRCGWCLVHEEDVTPAARITVDVLQALTARYRQRLQDELGIGAAELDGLERSNQRYRDCYQRGIYGYRVLRFERDAAPQARRAETLLRVDERSAPAVRELFRQVFGHDMSPAHWQWKYGAGRGTGVALSREGRLVAHYAGMSRRVLQCGEPALAWQIGDVMVAPEANRALVRQGPLLKVAATFLEAEMGWGRPHRFGFGFPNDRAIRVAELLGLYTAVDAVDRHAWPAAGIADPRYEHEWMALDGRFSADERGAVDASWAAMASALGDTVLGVRDAAWLSYRYLERPQVAYRLALVRERATRTVVGIVVMRDHETHVDVLDLVGAPASFGALIGVARAHAGATGKPSVSLWITRSQQHRLAAADPGAATVHDMGITIPANVHVAGPPAEAFRQRWFLLAGDADFT